VYDKLLKPRRSFRTTLYSAFEKQLCTYERYWKWCPRASIQAWTSLILFAKTFCKSEFGKSLCTYKSCWKWCPRPSIQAWSRLIVFAQTFCRSAFGKSLCTYKRCWKWCPRLSIQVWTKSTHRSLGAQQLSERTVYTRKTWILIWGSHDDEQADYILCV
jgi:Pyruvate/2-oxoacid:ferredoxin oxidoreductase delta subunit